jgi:hypothetical protein
MRGAGLILALALAAAPASAQEELRLGTPLPVMETIICYTQRAAQAVIAQSRPRSPPAALPADCVQSLATIIPQEVAPGLGRFDAPVRSYTPGAASCVEHRVEETTHRIPVTVRRQPARFVVAHVIHEDGSPQDMRALVLLPLRPYSLEFLLDPNRRDAAGPCG